MVRKSGRGSWTRWDDFLYYLEKVILWLVVLLPIALLAAAAILGIILLCSLL